jgi:hypothetical protein
MMVLVYAPKEQLNAIFYTAQSHYSVSDRCLICEHPCSIVNLLSVTLYPAIEAVLLRFRGLMCLT